MSNINSEFPQKYFGDPQHMSSDSHVETKQVLKNFPRYRRKHLVAFINNIPSGGTLLDVGCGKGKTVRLVKRLRPDVKIIAADLTDMSAFLGSDVDFHQVSADDIGTICAPGVVDAVVSEHVLEHMVYPNGMFNGIFTVLKPGGRVYIETPNWTRLILPFSPLYFWNDYTHVHPYCITAMRRAYFEFGFKEVYVKSVSSTDFGKRFLKTRVENGKVVTGLPNSGAPTKPPQTLLRKVFNAALDLTIHPFAKDILIGVAEKPGN